MRRRRPNPLTSLGLACILITTGALWALVIIGLADVLSR